MYAERRLGAGFARALSRPLLCVYAPLYMVVLIYPGFIESVRARVFPAVTPGEEGFRPFFERTEIIIRFLWRILGGNKRKERRTALLGQFNELYLCLEGRWLDRK